MAVPSYVDSDDLVWRRRWLDSTSAAARTFNVGQCVVKVRDTVPHRSTPKPQLFIV